MVSSLLAVVVTVIAGSKGGRGRASKGGGEWRARLVPSVGGEGSLPTDGAKGKGS